MSREENIIIVKCDSCGKENRGKKIPDDWVLIKIENFSFSLTYEIQMKDGERELDICPACKPYTWKRLMASIPDCQPANESLNMENS